MSTQKSVQPAQSVVPEDTMGIEPTASIDEAIQGALGRKLRESYDQVVREQVPDKFMQLLDQLKSTEIERDKRQGNAKADNDSA